MNDAMTLADLLDTKDDALIDLYVDATLADLTSNNQPATV